MTVTTSAKITALDAISGSTLVSTDVLVIVDVSDTTMAASGTDFKIQVDQLATTMANFLPASSVGIAAVANFGEAVQDVMGVTLQSTSTVIFTYNDAGNAETASVAKVLDSTWITDFTEAAQDAMGSALQSTSTVIFTYNDGGNAETASVAKALDASWVTNFTTSVSSFVYAASTFPVPSIASFGEAVMDVMGVALQSTSTIGFVYTDGSDKEEAYLAVDVYSIVQGVDTVTTTNYTLVLADAGHLKLLNTTTAGVFRVPLNASVALPIGTHVDGAMVNVGQYTLTTQAGVTLISNPAAPKTTTSAAFSVIKTATDTWLATGYLV